jgi:predicted dehydrogenase
VHFVLGREVVKVFADVRSLESEGDSAVLQMRLADSVPVQVFVSLGTAEEAVFEVFGQHGKVTVNRYRSVAARLTGMRVHSRLRSLWNGFEAVRGLPYFIQRLRATANEPSYAAALTHFFDAIRGHHHACPDFLDGYRSLSVVSAAEKSVRTCRPAPVELPYRAVVLNHGASGTACSHDYGSELS